MKKIQEKGIPCVIAWNKADLSGGEQLETENSRFPLSRSALPQGRAFMSSRNVWPTGRQEENERRIIGDLLSPGDFVVLVVPIDKAAPRDG